ncbi:MAG: HIT family protein [Rhodospirillales bacterium]|nr:HIT family protein [Rhodospirillales bacterium]
MAIPFSLDARLAADTLPVGRFSLSRLLLMNDATYPWLILVPERPGVSEFFDLDPADVARLVAETTLVARMLKRLAQADKINVAALGNVVTQLHVHVVARFATDPAWPAPVWGRAPPRQYAGAEAWAMLTRTRAALDALASAAEAPPGPPGEDQAAAAGWRRHAG